MNQVKNIRFIKKNKEQKANSKTTSPEPTSKDINTLLEENWNNRFHLEKVPNYNSLTDANCFSNKTRLKAIRQQDVRLLNEITYKRSNPNFKKERGNISLKYKFLDRKINSSKSPKINNIEKNTIPLPNHTISSKPSIKVTTFNFLESDLYSVLKNLWECLGVNKCFKKKFIKILKVLSKDDAIEYLKYEISSLRKFNDILVKLGQEIKAREEIIKVIKDAIEKLVTVDDSQFDSLITSIYNFLKNLRVLSVNIVIYFMKFWDVAGSHIFNEKYQIDKISSVFNFNKNYLEKMVYDTDFLRENSYSQEEVDSDISHYFNISDVNCFDPFLLAFSKEISPNKLTIGISDDTINTVYNCQFYIFNYFIEKELKEESNKPEFNLTMVKQRSKSNSKLNSVPGTSENSKSNGNACFKFNNKINIKYLMRNIGINNSYSGNYYNKMKKLNTTHIKKDTRTRIVIEDSKEDDSNKRLKTHERLDLKNYEIGNVSVNEGLPLLTEHPESENKLLDSNLNTVINKENNDNSCDNGEDKPTLIDEELLKKQSEEIMEKSKNLLKDLLNKQQQSGFLKNDESNLDVIKEENVPDLSHSHKHNQHNIITVTCENEGERLETIHTNDVIESDSFKRPDERRIKDQELEIELRERRLKDQEIEIFHTKEHLTNARYSKIETDEIEKRNITTNQNLITESFEKDIIGTKPIKEDNQTTKQSKEIEHNQNSFEFSAKVEDRVDSNGEKVDKIQGNSKKGSSNIEGNIVSVENRDFQPFQSNRDSPHHGK